MKNLIRLLYINILILSTALYGQSIDSINYSAYNYGYSLQKSYSISPLDMSANVRECKKYNTDSEIYFCVVGSALKAFSREMGGIEEMKASKNSNMDSFVSERLSFISKQSLSNTEENKFYVGFEIYEGSGDYTNGYYERTSSIDVNSYLFNVGYGKGYDFRNELYIKKTTFSNRHDVSEYGINWMKPIEKLSYKNQYYPYIKIGVAFIKTSSDFFLFFFI